MTDEVRPVWWDNGTVKMIDQNKIPFERGEVTCTNVAEVRDAIVTMVVRGAPAIGVAAAYGIALDARNSIPFTIETFKKHLNESFDMLAQSRPTAVNLHTALERMKESWVRCKHMTPSEIADELLKAAQGLYEDELAANKAIGKNGLTLFRKPVRVLTHCNAGALATAGYGTALGVVRSLKEHGLLQHVWVDETRPRLQGAKITIWEMIEEKIPATLIVDSAAAYVMAQGEVDAIIVGADRIAANGDVANKIGTYNLAVLAAYHRVPFYVAAPMSTVDFTCPKGAAIPVEERSRDEVHTVVGQRVADRRSDVYNPAFDVTPHDLISAIITDAGVVKPDFAKNLKALCSKGSTQARDKITLKVKAPAGAGAKAKTVAKPQPKAPAKPTPAKKAEPKPAAKSKPAAKGKPAKKK